MKINPLEILLAIVIKAVLFGVMLSIAWPVAQMLMKAYSAVYINAKGLLRKEETINVEDGAIS